jgi:hypothetical protein
MVWLALSSWPPAVLRVIPREVEDKSEATERS